MLGLDTRPMAMHTGPLEAIPLVEFSLGRSESDAVWEIYARPPFSHESTDVWVVVAGWCRHYVAIYLTKEAERLSLAQVVHFTE